MALLLFLIFVNYAFSLSFLISLTRGLSSLLTFPKNYILAPLIFSTIFLISMPLISTLILMISFLLLNLGFRFYPIFQFFKVGF